jgi:hypothetical protein
LDFKQSTTENFRYLFELDEGSDESNEEEKQFSTNYGWYPSLYAAAGGQYLKLNEVTKTNIMEFLTWLQFEKEKINLEILRIQKAKIQT